MHIKKEEFLVVYYKEVEKLISEEFDFEYNLVCCEELNNHSNIVVCVDGCYDIENIEEFLKTKDASFKLTDLLNKLGQDEKIEKGTYLIEVWW